MTQNNDDVSQTALQHLGSRMRESRQAREISLTEMARRLGYTKSHLSSVENGLSRPSRELVERYERECLLQPGRLTSIIPDLPAARHQSSLSKEVRSPSSGLHTNGGPSSGIGIFVSHSSADNLWTREFVARLRQAGEDVFYDEHSLGYGTHMRIIEQEIQSRPIFITVVSPAAVGSPWVTMESQAAIALQFTEHHRVFLPVVAAKCEMPLFWRTYNHIDGSRLSPAAAADRVLEALQHFTSDAPTVPNQRPIGAVQASSEERTAPPPDRWRDDE